MDIGMTFWCPFDERGSNGFASADLVNPALALTVLKERSGKIFVTSESHPLGAIEVGPEEVELWVPDWRKISEQLSSALGFFPCDPRGEGTTRQIGNIHSRKLASRLRAHPCRMRCAKFLGRFQRGGSLLGAEFLNDGIPVHDSHTEIGGAPIAACEIESLSTIAPL